MLLPALLWSLASMPGAHAPAADIGYAECVTRHAQDRTGRSRVRYTDEVFADVLRSCTGSAAQPGKEASPVARAEAVISLYVETRRLLESVPKPPAPAEPSIAVAQSQIRTAPIRPEASRQTMGELAVLTSPWIRCVASTAKAPAGPSTAPELRTAIERAEQSCGRVAGIADQEARRLLAAEGLDDQEVGDAAGTAWRYARALAVFSVARSTGINLRDVEIPEESPG